MTRARKTRRGMTLNRTAKALAVTILMMATIIQLSAVTAMYDHNQQQATTATMIVTSGNQQPETIRTPPPTPTPTKEWSYTTGDSIDSSPCVADVDGDTLQEVLVGSWDNKVYCLSRTGALKWSYPTGYLVRSSPCVADVDGDTQLEVVVGSFDHNVYCLSGTGAPEWSYPTGGSVSSSPCVADVDGDSQLEVLVGSDDNNVYCLSKTGVKDWNYTVDTIVSGAPVVADLEGDGKLEVLVGSDGYRLYCLNGTGGLKWVHQTYGGFDSPCVADFDGDRQLEVLAASDNVYCLSRTGAPEWAVGVGSYTFTTPAVADVDGDRQLEVLVCPWSGKVYCLDRKGGLEWSFTTGGYFDSSPCVADVDGDGQLEVLVSSYDGKVYCLSVVGAPYDTGAYPWPSIGFHGDVRHTGSFVDSDHDNLTDVYEGIVGTAYNAIDTDGDTAADSQEFTYSTNPFVDTVLPATIANLATGSATGESITLTWKSPGDNGATGSARGYVVKYSTTGVITGANWDSATEYPQSWVPLAAGGNESQTVSGLTADTQYWFAVEAYDETPNCGGVSNSPSGKTTDNVAPGAITDLSVIGVVGANVTLSWTAPGDNGNTGTAASYLVRYSISGAINDGNWGSATPYSQSWTPRAGGSAEVHTITGLSHDTIYWFAIKARDEVPQEGACSNSPEAAIGDDTWPGTVVDLVAWNATGNSVTLNWTAPGDNGASGAATGYIVKYSATGKINGSNWDSATTYVQSWTPLATGGKECYMISGLASDTTYWFAIKAYDEVPHYGDISNSPDASTTDIAAPDAIADLAVIGVVGNNVTLTWTAPGDNGAMGTATRYWVKYSTSGPITDANWGSATNYTQSWVPSKGGNAELHTITGLSANTTYWFAIKAYDEVPHESGISNSPSGTTTAPAGGGLAGTVGAAQTMAVAGLSVGAAGIVLAVLALAFSAKKKR